MADKTNKKLTRTKGDSTGKKGKAPYARVIFKDEKQLEIVKKKAEESGYKKAVYSGVSPFLRDLGLGYKPKSFTDVQAVSELREVKMNLSKIGNLIKGAIFCKPPHDANVIKQHLKSLSEIQIELSELIIKIQK